MLATLRADGAVVLMATHDLVFAAEHCARWLVLAEGTLVADARPAAVLGGGARASHGGRDGRGDGIPRLRRDGQHARGTISAACARLAPRDP